MSLIASFLPMFVSQFAAGALAPAPAAAPVAQGSPSPFEYQDPTQQPRVIMMDAQDGYGSPELPLDNSPVVFEMAYQGSPVPPEIYGDPAYGSIVSWARNQIGGAAQQVGVGSSAAINSNKKLIMENRTSINNTNKRVGSLANNVAQLRRTLTQKHDETERQKWLKTMLSMAQSLPGIRAYNVSHSEQARERDEALEDFAKAVEGLTIDATPISHAAVTPFASSYSEAGANAVLTALQAQINALTVRLNEVTSELDSLKNPAEALHAKQADYRKTIQPGDLVSVAKIIPSQIDKADQAVVEVIGKAVLGAAPNTGSGYGLSLNL